MCLSVCRHWLPSPHEWSECRSSVMNTGRHVWLKVCEGTLTLWQPITPVIVKEPRWVIMTAEAPPVKATSLQAQVLISLSVWFLAQRQVIGMFFPKWFLVKCVTQFFPSVPLISAFNELLLRVAMIKGSHLYRCLTNLTGGGGLLCGIMAIKILVLTINPKSSIFI